VVSRRAPVLISDGTNSITITDHPTQPDSTVVRIDGPAGHHAALTLGEPVDGHVHDWQGGRPLCQIGNCDEPCPDQTSRTFVGLHVCDWDPAGRCRYCNLEARRG
jgi:hypothetical protein